MTEKVIATATHGRYLVIPPQRAGPAPVLIGFHGYGEDAETQLERLRGIPGSERWLIVSVQGLHCFYNRRMDRVVAGWMTRQNRELAIADNIAYVRACIEAVAAQWPTLPTVVCAGFSQGVAMAFRAAVNSIAAAGVIAVGGDVPPEIDSVTLRRLCSVLIVRGAADEWYNEPQFRLDNQRLQESFVPTHALVLDAGHEWAPGVADPAADFLRRCYPE